MTKKHIIFFMLLTLIQPIYTMEENFLIEGLLSGIGNKYLDLLSEQDSNVDLLAIDLSTPNTHDRVITIEQMLDIPDSKKKKIAEQADLPQQNSSIPARNDFAIKSIADSFNKKFLSSPARKNKPSLKRKRNQRIENSCLTEKETILLITSKRTLMCQAKNCSHSSPHIGAFIRHLITQHKITNLIYCRECKSDFNNMKKYYQHNKLEHSSGKQCLIPSCTRDCPTPIYRSEVSRMIKNHSYQEWKKYIETYAMIKKPSYFSIVNTSPQNSTNQTIEASHTDAHDPILQYLDNLEASIQRELEEEKQSKRKRKESQKVKHKKARRTKKLVAFKTNNFDCKKHFMCTIKGCIFSSPHVGKLLKHFGCFHSIDSVINCRQCSTNFDSMGKYYQHNKKHHLGKQQCLIPSCNKACQAPISHTQGTKMFKKHSNREWINHIEECASKDS